MAGTTLGTAYVQIVPSAQGISGSISNVLGGEAASAGTSVGSKIAGFAKKAILAAGIGTAVVKSVKTAMAQGADLEQNIGGAYAVFGDKLYGTLEKQATQAYKNMGLSASDYYATANKMGSLFQGSGLSQKKSLDLTTSAMQRAADVASVMGLDTSMAMESIAGAAKGNFTMMDNLGVAMNATTLEAYALEKGLNFKWNTASNAEKAELAMKMFMDRTSQYAGNFARESDETFSGSLGAMKAAYQDFMGSLALGEGVSRSMESLVQTASTFFFGNFLPMLGTIIGSLPKAIGTFLAQGVPLLLSNISSLISTLATNITTVANGLTGAKVSQWAQTTIPKLVVAAGQMIGKFAASLVANLPKIVLAIGRIGLSIVTGLGSALWGKVTEAANGIKDRFMAPINTMRDKVKGILDKIKNFFPVNLGKILHFSLPKISVSGGQAPWGIGGKGSKPSFSVNWAQHAEGGIFSRRVVMAEGNTFHEFNENGREAILPLDPFWAKMDKIVDAVQNGSGGITFNVYAAPGQSAKEVAQEVKKIIITETNRGRLAWQ